MTVGFAEDGRKCGKPKTVGRNNDLWNNERFQLRAKPEAEPKSNPIVPKP